VAQELYNGQRKKTITYPRAEMRCLPQSLITDVPRIVAGLRMGQSFSTIRVAGNFLSITQYRRLLGAGICGV
jgi:DNA topoisomerase-3